MEKDKENKQHNYIPMTSIKSGKGREVKKGVYYYTNQIVNLAMIGDPSQGDWVLVDAGMPKCGPEILSVIENRFGKENKPSAVLLTHGHFDHVGGLQHLLEKWDVPVYAHPLEFPYLSGQQEYPKPDPSVEGGLLAKVAFIYPTDPIDIQNKLHPLPPDHSLPFLPGWEWVPTPGHSPGHVSFFRREDRVLISGDAFITVKQDSLYKVLLQKEEINGPPRYLTTDWQLAWDSVRQLNSLHPNLVIPGHGNAMEGSALEDGLKLLAKDFDTMAIPDHGKYL
jgi:glyoxylase-like metal-dependent hydrolase (beta-lactamase superfamily II)